MALELEWDKVHEEAIRHFVALLKLDTTNPPGNEHLAVSYVKEVLESEGLASTVIESAPGRANLVSRMRGAKSDTGLLLSSHVDVVPAEPDRWRVDPFAGEIVDGEIYGRGAIDMKNMTAYSLMAALVAKRMGWDLKHDLVVNCFADEEAGCEYGSRYMVEHHPDLLASRYAFNEVGGFTLHVGKHRLYPIQVTEKGFVWLKMRATGDPGHGSMPHSNNAVAKLARAVDRLDRVSTPLQVHPIVEGFFEEMGSCGGSVTRFFLALARNPLFSDLVVRKVLPLAAGDKAKAIYASLHNTVNPTGLAAGAKVNVIPSTAEVVLDCRVMPGVTQEQLIREIEAIVGPGFEFELINKGISVDQQHQTPMLDLLCDTVAAKDPGAKAIPSLTVGFTDSAELIKLGIICYGFTPVKLPPDLDFANLFHGHDERLPVDGFRWGLETFLEAVHGYCVRGEGDG